jgi:hypothetical protein
MIEVMAPAIREAPGAGVFPKMFSASSSAPLAAAKFFFVLDIVFATVEVVE